MPPDRPRAADKDAIAVPPEPAWPSQADAKWPTGCGIEDLGVHPHLPWLTLALTDPNDEVDGAVVVIDVESGSLRSVSPCENGAGWYGDGGLVLWDTSGARLATNALTSAIAVLERGELVGVNGPDDGRDSPVDYAWVDHRIYTDTGHFFDPKNEVSDGRFDFEPVDGIVWSVDTFKWVPGIEAVVGAAYPTRPIEPKAIQLVAYAPQREEEVYRRPIEHYKLSMQWSPNRRWAAAQRQLPYPRSANESVLDVYDTHSGEKAREVVISGAQLRVFVVGNDATIVASSYSTFDDSVPARSEVFTAQGTHRVLSTELPSRGLSELAPNMALSPDGHGLALLLDDASIALFDLQSGQRVLEFPAPVPASASDDPPAVGLLWVTPTRLATIGQEFVDLWSVDGGKVASFAMPQAR